MAAADQEVDDLSGLTPIGLGVFADGGLCQALAPWSSQKISLIH